MHRETLIALALNALGAGMVAVTDIPDALGWVLILSGFGLLIYGLCMEEPSKARKQLKFTLTGLEAFQHIRKETAYGQACFDDEDCFRGMTAQFERDKLTLGFVVPWGIEALNTHLDKPKKLRAEYDKAGNLSRMFVVTGGMDISPIYFDADQIEEYFPQKGKNS